MEIVEIKNYSPENLKAVQKFAGILLSEEYMLTEEFFKQILDSDNSHLFFILEGENIAGMLTVGTYKSPIGAKAWIEDVVIDDMYRGKGYGKSIVEYAIDYVRNSGIDFLMLTSNPTRIAANKLYQDLGFERKETNVYKMSFKK
ncbi:MAG: GNAT family N-acetyltransferase [Prevotella sp.]|jgi:ribosomal protein S18 acetylase RimI-like enzyme|nr:GNAT family N-acetyltransferase [Prevotella sp.]